MTTLPQVDAFLAFSIIILVGCVSVAIHDWGLRRKWWTE